MKMFFGKTLATILIGLAFQTVIAADNGWWPAQAAPEIILVCPNPLQPSECNLLQSLSGLAAKSVNERAAKEGVWVRTYNHNYEVYFKSLVKRTKAKVKNIPDVWSLLSHLSTNDVVRGYVLYDDRNPVSLNIATTRAGILRAALVEKGIRSKVDSMGLECLFDASDGITERDNFEFLKRDLNKRLLVLSSPKIFNNRDLAIAHNAIVHYGVDSLLTDILEWIEPLSPVVGWNEGPEAGHIRPCTEYGLINTVSDFCMNLPMLSCADQSGERLSFRKLNPKSIDWNSDKPVHSFVMSDGDNLQWMMGSFISSKEYWRSRYSSSIPMNYTTCAVNLSMTAVDPLAALVAGQPRKGSVIEYGGGYYYPDLFACRRGEAREDLLRALARKVNTHMKRTGTSVLAFICMDMFSGAAKDAYRIFAEEIDGLLGILTLQYSPYNRGDGKLLWVNGKNGFDVPICSARYQIWANLDIPGSGNPQKVAIDINEDAGDADSPVMSWTIVHAWSRYIKDVNGNILDASQDDRNATRGVSAVYWGTRFLDSGTAVVSVEELLWRMRMAHDPEGTRQMIDTKTNKSK